MNNGLEDYAQRLHTTHAEFEPGHIKCDLGPELFYIDANGYEWVQETSLNDYDNLRSEVQGVTGGDEGGGGNIQRGTKSQKERKGSIHKERYSKNPVKGKSGGGNWRDHKRRAIEKKRSSSVDRGNSGGDGTDGAP